MPPMRILLAEDESVIARLISRVLDGNGDTVDRVASCRDAIDRIRAEPFDLVMLDIHLSDGDGFRVVDAIESDPGRRLPVLLITGDRVDADDPRSARVDGILSKPFDVNQLETAVGAFRR